MMAKPLISLCRRRALLALPLWGLGLQACSEAEDAEKPVGRGRAGGAGSDVVYFDVNLNGHDIGVAGGPPHGGPGGLMTGVPVPLGPQQVTWRLGGPEGMPGNGDTVKAANTPVLERPASRYPYLGVHIYPNNTVELIPEMHWPEASQRGEQINRQWDVEHAP